MRLIPVGVAMVVAALYFVGLGDAPFVDPPEGAHAAVARAMIADGDPVTPRLDGVRYLDTPPLLYWLMSAGFGLAGVSTFTARFWSALAGVACAAVTARLGTLLGGPRVGLIAGLMVAANLGIYLSARIVEPDLLFVLLVTLAFAGFAAAYLGRSARWGLALFYGALGLAMLAKNLLAALGVLLAAAVFFWITRERPLRPWVPWWGWALCAVLGLSWYVAAEAANRGFLWRTVVDGYLLTAGRRVFPGADVPLTALEFLVVTAAGFLPWTLVAPWAVARALRRDWKSAADRIWALFALWALLVIGVITFSPFKLPHYGLPAFPALALLVAALWDDTLAHRPGALPARALVTPVAVVFAAAALGTAAAWAGLLPNAHRMLTWVDVTARNLAARGEHAAERPLDAFRPVLALCTLVFAGGAGAAAVAAWRRSAEIGLIAALAVMLAFLPAAGRGMAEFARGRSVEPVAAALLRRAGPGDLIVHEGPVKESASILLRLAGPVPLVAGRVSSLAFGATFPEARDLFWDTARLQRAWAAPGRHFLVSTVAPARSVVRRLPAGTAHLVIEGGGRRLYSNVGE